jgi:hypothetical protein
MWRLVLLGHTPVCSDLHGLRRRDLAAYVRVLRLSRTGSLQSGKRGALPDLRRRHYSVSCEFSDWQQYLAVRIAELGRDADPFMLHLYAALA